VRRAFLTPVLLDTGASLLARRARLADRGSLNSCTWARTSNERLAVRFLVILMLGASPVVYVSLAEKKTSSEQSSEDDIASYLTELTSRGLGRPCSGVFIHLSEVTRRHDTLAAKVS